MGTGTESGARAEGAGRCFTWNIGIRRLLLIFTASGEAFCETVYVCASGVGPDRGAGLQVYSGASLGE
jgi:hypothetical protein